MSEIIEFPAIQEAIAQNATDRTGYAKERAEHVVLKLGELGLYDEAADIARVHFGDLVPVFVTDNRSTLSVERTVVSDGSSQKVAWGRRASISVPLLDAYTKQLQLKIGKLPATQKAAGEEFGEVVGLSKKVDKKQQTAVYVRSIALDWIMSELAVDVMYNSLDMQRKFGKYVPDYTSEYLSGLYTPNDTHRIEGLKAERAGFALEVLHDDLIRRRVVTYSQEATDLTDSLRDVYPMLNIHSKQNEGKPCTKDELCSRLESFRPASVIAGAQLSIAQVIDMTAYRKGV